MAFNPLIYGKFDHSIPMVSTHPGTRSAGYTEKAWGDARYVNMSAGANKVINICHRPLVYVKLDGGFNTPGSHDWVFEMVVNPMNAGGTYAGECVQGIQFGAFDQVTPWQTNYATDSGQGCVQFRFNFTLQRYEVLVWNGDAGTPPLVVPCDINPAFTPDQYAKKMRMNYSINDADSPDVPTLRCYLNDRIAIKHRSPELTSWAAQQPKYMFGYFATVGSDPARTIVEAGFHENYYAIDMYS